MNSDILSSNLKENKYKKINYIVLFGIIFLSSGFGIQDNLGGKIVLLGSLVLSSGLFLFHKNIKYRKRVLVLVFLFLLNILITTMYRGNEVDQFLIYAVYIIVAFILSQILKNDFNVVYVKLFYFLSIFSLTMTSIYIIFPKIIRSFPIISNRYGLKAYMAFFSTITSFGNVKFPRNQGIFWEPGAFQTFLNIAFAIVLFTDYFREKKLKYILVFSMTILTTFSTTGYIVFLGLVLVYYMSELIKTNRISRLVKLITFLGLVLFIFFISYLSLPNDLKFQLFGKLIHYSNNTEKITSTSIRVNAIKNAVIIFFKYPILGCGISNKIIDTNNLMTCTPVNYFAFYGIFAGFVNNLGLFMYSKSLVNKKKINFLLFICFMLSIISENYMRHPIILTLNFLGLSKINVKKSYKLRKIKNFRSI